MPTVKQPSPSGVLVTALIHAVPKAALTPTVYQVILDASKMVEDVLL